MYWLITNLLWGRSKGHLGLNVPLVRHWQLAQHLQDVVQVIPGGCLGLS